MGMSLMVRCRRVKQVLMTSLRSRRRMTWLMLLQLGSSSEVSELDEEHLVRALAAISSESPVHGGGACLGVQFSSPHL